jgi:hypothetical protein
MLAVVGLSKIRQVVGQKTPRQKNQICRIIQDWHGHGPGKAHDYPFGSTREPGPKAAGFPRCHSLKKP